MSDELFGKSESVKDKVPYRSYGEHTKPVRKRIWVPIEEVADAAVALRTGGLEEYERVCTWLALSTRRLSLEDGPEDGKRGDVEIINHRINTHWLTGRPPATLVLLAQLPRLRTGPLTWAESNYVVRPFVVNRNDQPRVSESVLPALLNRRDNDKYLVAALRDARAGIPPVPTGELVDTTDRLADLVKAMLAMGEPPYPPTRRDRAFTDLICELDGEL